MLDLSFSEAEHIIHPFQSMFHGISSVFVGDLARVNFRLYRLLLLLLCHFEHATKQRALCRAAPLAIRAVLKYVQNLLRMPELAFELPYQTADGFAGFRAELLEPECRAAHSHSAVTVLLEVE